MNFISADDGEARPAMEAVGEAIKQARLEKGLTQAGLSELVGIDQSSIARWESGQREIMLSTLAEIADALGHTLSSLLEGV